MKFRNFIQQELFFPCTVDRFEKVPLTYVTHKETDFQFVQRAAFRNVRFSFTRNFYTARTKCVSWIY